MLHLWQIPPATMFLSPATNRFVLDRAVGFTIGKAHFLAQVGPLSGRVTDPELLEFLCDDPDFYERMVSAGHGLTAFDIVAVRSQFNKDGSLRLRFKAYRAGTEEELTWIAYEAPLKRYYEFEETCSPWTVASKMFRKVVDDFHFEFRAKLQLTSDQHLDHVEPFGLMLFKFLALKGLRPDVKDFKWVTQELLDEFKEYHNKNVVYQVLSAEDNRKKKDIDRNLCKEFRIEQGWALTINSKRPSDDNDQPPCKKARQ